MFKKSTTRRNRKANRSSNVRRQQRLNGVESSESKQLLTALHVNQFDAQPDDRGCGDFSNECNSIGNALRFATDGDDIVLRPGVYHENVVIGKSVDINSIGGRSTIRPEAGPVAITTGVGVNVALRNLDLTGGLAGIDAIGTNHLELFDVRANDNAAHGIVFDGGQILITSVLHFTEDHGTGWKMGAQCKW